MKWKSGKYHESNPQYMQQEVLLNGSGQVYECIGSGYDFVDKDSYQVCSKLLHIFQVNNCGNLLLTPPAKNSDDLTCLVQEDSDDSSTADREVGSLELLKCSSHRDNFAD